MLLQWIHRRRVRQNLPHDRTQDSFIRRRNMGHRGSFMSRQSTYIYKHSLGHIRSMSPAGDDSRESLLDFFPLRNFFSSSFGDKSSWPEVTSTIHKHNV